MVLTQAAQPICRVVRATDRRADAFRLSVEDRSDDALPATPIVEIVMQFLLHRGKSAAGDEKSVHNRARVPKRNLPPLSKVHGSVGYEIAVDLKFPLLRLAIATGHEELRRSADRARQLRLCAKVHPGSFHAREQPTRLHAHKIGETNRVAELVPARPLMLQQVATNNARHPPRISASAAAAVAAPNLPFANVCGAQLRRSDSPMHPD